MRDYFLADDLSGALDAAAGFRAAGRSVRIVWTVDAWDAAPRDTLVGFTTETRNAAPEEAAAVVARTLEHGKRRGAKLWYKKIDSTLRGAVAAELRAVMHALPQSRVLFTPANPRVGRTVRGGVLLLHGVPVAETEFGRDPANPVRESAIAALLGVSVRDGIEIADAATEADLAAAVGRLQAMGGDWVAVGSGALARPVARAAAVRAGLGSMARPDATVATLRKGPRLMICGSAHPANRAQAQQLAERHHVPVCEVAVEATSNAVVRAIEAMREHGGATLMLAAERTAPARALEAITAAAAETIRAARVNRMFITGGETAYGLCGRLGVSYLDFGSELEPGLCLATAEAKVERLLLAVKPGGFGDTRTWIRAWDALA